MQVGCEILPMCIRLLGVLVVDRVCGIEVMQASVNKCCGTVRALTIQRNSSVDEQADGVGWLANTKR